MCLCRRTRMQGAPGLRVAIVGAGPAGAALATLLTQDGHDVVLFDDGAPSRAGRRRVADPGRHPAAPPARHRGRGRRDRHGEARRDAHLVADASLRVSFRALPPMDGAVRLQRAAPRLRSGAARARRGGRRAAHHDARRASRAAQAAGATPRARPRRRCASPRPGGPPPDLVVDATGRARVSARAARDPAPRPARGTTSRTSRTSRATRGATSRDR